MDYKKAGVDIEAGYKSVELMKEYVKETMRAEVLGGLGGFSGAFSLAKIKEMEDLLFQIGTCLNVGSVHKNRFCVQISFLCRGFQHPAEHIFHRGVVESVLEVVTHCGEVRHCFVQRISDEPPVCQIHAHFLQGSA